jgi:hypothetical protein
MPEIKFKTEIAEPGTLYLIPNFIKCIHCGHEIPIGLQHLTGVITDNGGCKKTSSIYDYGKYFGVIKDIG